MDEFPNLADIAFDGILALVVLVLAWAYDLTPDGLRRATAADVPPGDVTAGVEADAEVYRAGSALEQDPSGITEKLLVVHGMADDNVLFAHTLKLSQALQEEGALFELMAAVPATAAGGLSVSASTGSATTAVAPVPPMF